MRTQSTGWEGTGKVTDQGEGDWESGPKEGRDGFVRSQT